MKNNRAIRLSLLLSAMAVVPSVSAQEAASSGDEEIIVTAQKRGQKLQEVPIAITTATGPALERAQITEPMQLPELVPGLRVASSYQRNVLNYTLRGIGPSNQYNFNTNAPVGLYADEIYQTFSPSPAIQFLDLARVEVLKGPQGTLYGRNTTGGAINFISNQPSLSNEADGYVRLTYGNLNKFVFEGATDIPLIEDKLGMRAAVLRSTADGYMRDGHGGDGYGSDDTVQGRLIVRGQPSPDLEISLKLFGNRANGTSPSGMSYGVLPGGTNPFGYSRDGLPDDRGDIDHLGDMKATSWGGSLTVNWDASERLTITSITGAQDAGFDVLLDCDASPSDLCRSDYYVDSDQFSQDLRATYTGDNFTLIAGAFYGTDNMDFTGYVGFGALNLRNHYKQKRESAAVYADIDYNVTEALSVTVGFRYTDDTTSIKDAQTAILSGPYGDPILTTIPANPAYSPDNVLPKKEESSNDVTGRFVVEYKIDPDVMVYASYGRGYRAGAFNGQFFFSENELNYVGPETDNHYELGLKGAFWDNRVSLNAALFQTDIKGQQILSQISTGIATYPGLAGVDGTTRGVELEASVAATDALDLHGTLNYLDTEFDDGQFVGLSPGVDISGHRFPFAPEWAWSAGFEWRFWNRDDQTLTLSANANHTGQFFFDPENGVNSIGALLPEGQDAYTLFDARLAYEIGDYEVSAWVENLSDKFYYVFAANAEGLGYDYTVRGAPRTYGITARARF